MMYYVTFRVPFSVTKCCAHILYNIQVLCMCLINNNNTALYPMRHLRRLFIISVIYTAENYEHELN